VSMVNLPSRVDDPGSRRYGTFSYLPPLSQEQVTRQVEYMLARDWSCWIEHVEPSRSATTYWYLWKLPMFGEFDAAVVMDEVDACRRAYPDDCVRLVGYDQRRQTQGLSFVVHRGVPR
jgi:ribulose-bisphosphate carboxylase small chain